jgi:hypothetical protein
MSVNCDGSVCVLRHVKLAMEIITHLQIWYPLLCVCVCVYEITNTSHVWDLRPSQMCCIWRPSSLTWWVIDCWYFEWSWCLNCRTEWSLFLDCFILKMKTLRSFELTATLRRTTQHCILDDLKLTGFIQDYLLWGLVNHLLLFQNNRNHLSSDWNCLFLFDQIEWVFPHCMTSWDVTMVSLVVSTSQWFEAM